MKNIKCSTIENNGKRRQYISLFILLCMVFFTGLTGYGRDFSDSAYVADSIDNKGSYGAFVDSNVWEMKNKVLIFMEYENGMIIDRIDLRTGEKKRILDIDAGEWEDHEKKDTGQMRGHWSGIEFGLNDFVTNDYNLSRPAGYGFLDLNNWRSWNLTLNFAQNTTPIIDDHLAIVGGMGLEWNIYHFQDQNNLQVNPLTGDIEERLLADDLEVRKSKFNTFYLTSPLLLEAQFGKGNSDDKFYISGGVIGGLRVMAARKVVYGEKGDRKKQIERGHDLQLHRWRWGLTARMGYKDVFNFYANYYITPLFKTSHAPELHPVAIGCRVNF
jgi:hypothetical protein